MRYPAYNPALQIAVLTPDLSLSQVRRRMGRCRVVAAAVPLLRSLAVAVESGSLTLPPVDAAVIAFTGICHGELTVLERDLFWRVFQVPVFEQLLSPEGRILALECDAHDGLHLLGGGTPPGFSGVLDRTPCGCGNPQPRITRVESMDSNPAPGVCPAMAAEVYHHCDQQDQEIRPTGRVA